MQVEIPPELEREIEKPADKARLSKEDWVRRSLAESVENEKLSAVEQMSRLNAPTCDIEQMLAEIDAGRSQCFRDFEDLP